MKTGLLGTALAFLVLPLAVAMAQEESPNVQLKIEPGLVTVAQENFPAHQITLTTGSDEVIGDGIQNYLQGAGNLDGAGQGLRFGV